VPAASGSRPLQERLTPLAPRDRYRPRDNTVVVVILICLSVA
jgi:hypothetical protein